MSRRTAAWLAWSLCALSLALTGLSLLLLALNLSYPNTYVYDYWLDNTLGTLSFAPVGALIAARRPANPIGWLLCLYGVALGIGHFSAQWEYVSLVDRFSLRSDAFFHCTPLVVRRTLASQGGVDSLAIVKDLEVFEHRAPHRPPGGP
ncbi:hypothetical protein BH20ACT10_BH20ACT10_15450 [soil metagenome]